MKKLIMAALVLSLAISPALAGQKGGKMAQGKNEYAELTAKYKKETDPAKKAAIEKEVRTKVSANYDKRIAEMDKRASEAKEKLGKMENMLVEAKKPEVKEQRVEKFTQQILKGEKPAFGEGRKGEGKSKRSYERKGGHKQGDAKKADNIKAKK